MSDWLIQPPFDLERDDWGAQLIRDWGSAEITAGQRVLVLGAGAGGVGVPLARAGAQVVFVDDSLAALHMAQKTIEHARTTATFVLTPLFQASEPFDVALLNILWWADAERGADLIHFAAQHVKPGGLIVLAGSKNTGIKGAETLLNTVGSTSTLLYKKGHRLIGTQRPAEWHTPAKVSSFHDVHVRDMQFELLQAAGVFDQGNLDAASTMLIEVLQIPEGARVLDLGCGSGILGMAVKRLQPTAEVTLVDSNSRAVEVARANLAHNGIEAEVLVSNGVSEILNRAFDVVVTNPPFHIGRIRSEKLAHFFIREAHRLTVPKGQIWLVANQFLRYEPQLEAVWGSVDTVTSDSRFKVLRATKRG